MILKVMLVDDEPGALRFLEHMIASRCPGWEVVCTANNGRQALASIEKARPDMVMTDIRMPVLDGIGFIERLKDDWPNIRSVVISGYEDFEAAQNAIRHGVSDYLLKPVKPAQLLQTMENARHDLLERKWHEAVALLIMAVSGEQPDSARVTQCFGTDQFQAALVRVGALPSKYSDRLHPGHRSLINSREELPDYCWLLAGRDEWELTLFQADGFSSHSIEDIAKTVVRFLPEGKFTIAVSHIAFLLANANKTVVSLMRLLDENIVLNKNQILHNDKLIISHKTSAPVDPDIEQKVVALSTGCCQTVELSILVRQLFYTWQSEERPLVLVYRDTRKLLAAIMRGIGHHDYQIDHDQLLEQAILLSKDISQLYEKVWNIIIMIISSAEKMNAAPGSAAFFEKVKKYIDHNLSTQISLKDLCTVMGISRTYMSQIFRRNTGLSFSTYLTEQRINRAAY